MASDQAPAPVDAFPSTIKRKLIAARNPTLDCNYVSDLRKLYKGGAALLHDKAAMARMFPKHMREVQAIYEERVKRAVYVGHAGSIVDFITSSLASDPVVMKIAGQAEGAQLDEWYKKFMEDVSAPGGDRLALPKFGRDQVTEMLISRVAWTRVDMPKEGEFANLGEQARAGNLDAYLVPTPTETVIDWKEGAGGELLWVKVEDSELPITNPWDGRETIRETWKMWTRTGWAIYEITRKVTGENIDPEKDAKKVSDGRHNFGRCPFVRTVLPEGLWVMDTLDSLARSHLNTRSTLDWMLKQDGDPQLYEFLGPEESTSGQPSSEAQEDAQRAVNQPRGAGHVQIRGKDDRAEYLSPDPAAAEQMRQTLDRCRDEMHQVMHMMAMSIDNNKTALGRSAESKKEDRSTTSVVLTALGQFLREHMVAVFDMVSRGREDKNHVGKWQAEGASHFQEDSADTVIERGASLQLAPKVMSPTFQRDVQIDIAKAWYGDRAKPEKLAAVEGEIQRNVTQDSMDEDEEGEGEETGSGKPPKLKEKPEDGQAGAAA